MCLTDIHNKLFFDSETLMFSKQGGCKHEMVTININETYCCIFDGKEDPFSVSLEILVPASLQVKGDVKFKRGILFWKGRRKLLNEIKVHYLAGPEIKSLHFMEDETRIVKGTFHYPDRWSGYIHPYFAILATGRKPLIYIAEELIRILSINGKYYFVTHFRKPESGGQATFIYRLENKNLIRCYGS